MGAEQLTYDTLLDAIGARVDSAVNAKMGNAGGATANGDTHPSAAPQQFSYAEIVRLAQEGKIVDEQGKTVSADALKPQTAEMSAMGLESMKVLGIPVVALGAGAVLGFTERTIASGLTTKVTAVDAKYVEPLLDVAAIWLNSKYLDRHLGMAATWTANGVLALNALQTVAPGVFTAIFDAISPIFTGTNNMGNRFGRGAMGGNGGYSPIGYHFGAAAHNGGMGFNPNAPQPTLPGGASDHYAAIFGGA